MVSLTSLPPGPQGDDLYHVYALCYAQARERQAYENFVFRDMHDGPMPMDFNVWIIRNSRRTILVDTGFGERAAGLRKRPLDHDPIDALRKLGLDARDIADVILTHLHYDHAGNLDRLPASRIHVQDSEVEFATGRCMCHAVMRYPYDVEDIVNFVRCTYSGRTRYHNGETQLYPGISLHPLPGHSKGLQGVRINTPRGRVLLASDASHYYANFLRHAPFIVSVDMGQTLQTYDYMQTLVDGFEWVIPGHDPITRYLYPSIRVAGIDLVVLHEPAKPHSRDELGALSLRPPPISESRGG